MVVQVLELLSKPTTGVQAQAFSELRLASEKPFSRLVAGEKRKQSCRQIVINTSFE